MINDNTIDMEAAGNKLISPYNTEQLQPHSYDAILGPMLKIAQWDEITGEHKWIDVDISVAPYLLHNGKFALGSTVEYLKLPQNLVGFVQGKSSVGRNGLQIENAGLIDAGFEGNITLELYNMAPWPILLKAGMRICQLHFNRVDKPVLTDYSVSGHYNKQTGPTTAAYNL
jgi:dCTP deaminase